MSKNPPDVALSSFINLCHRVGAASPYWCQGESGYVSVKYSQGSDRRMVIKRPLVRLADVGAAETWIDESVSDTQGLEKSDNLTPWSDAHHAAFHAELPQDTVIELTSLVALLMAHEQQGDMSVACWLAEHLRGEVAIIPYPRKVAELVAALRANSHVTALIIANYGVILQGDDKTVLDQWHAVEREFCERLGYLRLLRQLGGVRSDDANHSPTPKRNYLGGPIREKTIPASALVEKVQPARSGRRFGERQFVLKSDDPDIRDLWLAHQILYAECPNLRELPAAAVNAFVHRGLVPFDDDLGVRRR